MNGWAQLQQILTGSDGFATQARALAASLLHMNANTVAVYTRNALDMQLALSAAALAGCRVLLPSTTAAKTIAWCDGQCDVWYGDDVKLATKPYARPAKMPIEQLTLRGGDVVLMSSGSTGAAKSLTVTLEALFEEAAACAALFPAQVPEIRSSASLQHRYGLIFHALLPLLHGWQVEPLVYEMPEAMLAGSIQGIWWVSSPTFLHHLAEQCDFSQWRGRVGGILSAGGKLPVELKQTIEQVLDTVVFDIYGSSETGAIACRQKDVFHWLPAVSAAINDDQTQISAPWLTGNMVLNDRLQACDGGGFMIKGRRDSIIKLADKRIDLGLVAELIAAAPEVGDVHLAVHPQHERLFAWVALNQNGIKALRQQGRKAIAEQLRALVAADQPRVAVPRYWRFEAALPRNAQSKLSHDQVTAAILDAPREPEWTCVAQDEKKVHYRGRVPLDLLDVRGHFTHCGIVPGVVELKWVSALAKQWLQRDINMQQMENLKFRKLLRPYDPVDIVIVWNAARNKLQFTCENEQGVFASGRLVIND
ncbi:AMP-binding protein [Cardiobacteriaceae bacterium TAE3-ERU3]|nr:AMP-binding protein [Cardiobacteriaceae bacterium TAE3-ERU3]